MSRRAWWWALAVLAAVRVAVPLAVLAASGHGLPGLPGYRYDPLEGDANAYYAAARELIASVGRLRLWLAPLALGLVVAAVLLVRLWRRSPERRWLALSLGALCVALAASAVILEMHSTGAPVIGWPLVWALPMLPYRALGGPLGPDVAFGFALVLSLVANAVALAATAYAGLLATARRSVGVVAAGCLALWPFAVGVVAGHRAWQNGQWVTDVGLHLYTEPVSTALVAVGLALLLARATPMRLAGAGLALSYATTVRLSNGAFVLLALVLVAWRLGPRRALPFLAGLLAFAPIALAYWPSGYASLYGNPQVLRAHPFSTHFLATSWTHSLIFRPVTLLVLAPLAIVGAMTMRNRYALALLLALVLANAVFYSLYFYTAEHPRFLYAALPAVFVLEAAGAAEVARASRRLRRRTSGAPGASARSGASPGGARGS